MRLATILALLFLVLDLSAISAQAQYGVEFTAPETTATIYPDTSMLTEIRFPVHIKNIGSTSDQFIIDFPGQSLPPDWFATFCDDHVCFDLPYTVAVNPGDTVPNHIHVAINVFGETGTGWVLCSVTSVGNPGLHPELRFWIHAFPNGVENQEGFKGPRVQGVQVTPNPFREKCEIRLPSGVTVGIYDGLGRRIRELRAGGAPGFVWDGRDARGMKVPAGVYFFVSESGAERLTGKILRIR